VAVLVAVLVTKTMVVVVRVGRAMRAAIQLTSQAVVAAAEPAW